MKASLYLFILIMTAGLTNHLFARPMKIILDPGHGGKDRGAVHNHLVESQLVLAISLELQKLLKNDSRFIVHMTRKTNSLLGLMDRTRFASKMAGDVFISIHANYSTDGRAKGGEIFFQNHLPALEESMRLAHRESESHTSKQKPLVKALGNNSELTNIIRDLNQSYYLINSSELAQYLLANWTGGKRGKSRSIHQAPFYVLGNVSMPSVLIEVGFISNQSEGRRLSKKSYQKRIAKGIYKGLRQYKEYVDKQPHSILNSSHEN